ncbi:hypothetical protein A3E67_00795 [Candidatus Daviesbacteria bacterium RIFCSPHIGHO2_12_FULL_38_25]|uniref:Uncharacterized protein n=1 Tax=Candidatus Daviesbacteria bacterium GW2011_GWF2_38_6 TaxID=1618432 RepID=A0A0G0KJI4_9BACT|nr:MAG: hypothetical protein US99_C0007G0010 [Candidatus Daviesbacteria bacterium GW2011_GWF2_38_6]OGE43974.1 MAG: hypothetical protein A3E67_00795 [Candidatus Daviesbacteria bacterium RIFCSPHIGHO2_12_FULL_38_25]
MFWQGLIYDGIMRGFTAVPILLLLVLATGLVIYFNFSNHKNTLVKPVSQTESLPVYKNEKLGFVMQYPKEFTAKEDTEEEFNKRGNGDFRKNFSGYVGYEPGKFIGAVVVLDKNNFFDTNPFTVWIFNNDSNLTIDEWHHNYWYYPFVWGDFTSTGKFILTPKDEATVSGQQGKSGVIDYREGKPKFIYVPKNGKMYLFRIIGETGEQILSTFKFL